MAWTYSNWATETTAALRLTALRSHVAEVSAAMETRADSVSENGKSISRPQLQSYLDSLLRSMSTLEGQARGRAGGRSLYRASPRP